MADLVAVGKNGFGGTEYTYAGVMEFGLPTTDSELKWGDTIRDNGGKGRTVCVNECTECGQKLLGNTMLLVPIECGDHRKRA